MGIQTAKEKLIEKIESVANDSTSLEDLSYAAAALAKLSEADTGITDPNIYSVGMPGTYGFGVGALMPDDIPDGFVGLTGHNDPLSKNYGNYYDADGSHMVFIPKFWVKWSGNTALISSSAQTGYTMHEAFRFCNKGFFRDKTHVGNVAGKPISKISIAPISTALANNPLSDLTGTIPNTYVGMIDAMKLRSSDHHLESVFEVNALSVLSIAHAEASQNTSVCAFNDVLPYAPRGNNNNALKDTNDSGVAYVSAGNTTYPACALTGSGFPFSKTTHNGQACGVTDVNGNLWRVNIGITKLNEADAIFKILKTSVNPNDLTAANIHDVANYDDLDLTGLVDGNDGWTKYGNASNQVFDVSLRSMAGIPIATGVSAGGTNSFGVDGLYSYWRTNMLPRSGGAWDTGSYAGLFCRTLYHASSSSSSYVGGSACVSW